MNKADKFADDADINGLIKLNILTTLIVALTYGAIVFLSAYVAQDAMQSLVNSMPSWLTHGFEIAGGILPAVGFGMLLKVMLKKQYIPFLIVGFVVASFVQYSNLLPVAVIGAAFALFTYNLDKDRESLIVKSNNEGDDLGEGI